MLILVSLSAWCDAKFLSSLASLLLSLCSHPFTLSGKFILEPSYFMLLPWLYLPRHFIEADVELVRLTNSRQVTLRTSNISSHIAWTRGNVRCTLVQWCTKKLTCGAAGDGCTIHIYIVFEIFTCTGLPHACVGLASARPNKGWSNWVLAL